MKYTLQSTMQNTQLFTVNNSYDKKIVLQNIDGKDILCLADGAIDESVENGKISTRGWGFMGKLEEPEWLHASMIAYAEELGATPDDPHLYS